MMLDATQKYTDDLTADRLFGWQREIGPEPTPRPTFRRARKNAGETVAYHFPDLRKMILMPKSI